MKNVTEEILKAQSKLKEDVITKWESTGLLNGSLNPRGLAIVLESQRLLNENNDMEPAFKRISIPLLVRVFAEVKGASGSSRELSEWTSVKSTLKASFALQGDLDREAEEVAISASKLADALNEERSSINGDKVLIHCVVDEGNVISINYHITGRNSE